MQVCKYHQIPPVNLGNRNAGTIRILESLILQMALVFPMEAGWVEGCHHCSLLAGERPGWGCAPTAVGMDCVMLLWCHGGLPAALLGLPLTTKALFYPNVLFSDQKESWAGMRTQLPLLAVTPLFTGHNILWRWAHTPLCSSPVLHAYVAVSDSSSLCTMLRHRF